MKRFLSIAAITLVGLLLGMSLTSENPPTSSSPQFSHNSDTSAEIEPTVIPPSPERLLELVNEERAKVGVKPLKLNKDLATTAQWKADDMFKHDYFSHWPDTVDGEKNTEKYTVNLAMRKLLAANCVESSENIREQGTYNTSEAALAGWKSSKPHYMAMIDPKYDSTGFGIAGDKIVQHFCYQG